MADAINAAGTNPDIKQIYVNWKQLTAKEVVQRGEEGQQAPTEILKWAEEVSKLSNVPDDVTYDIAQGETDIDRLNELINPELAIPEENNELAQNGTNMFEQEQETEPNIAQTGIPEEENPNSEYEIPLTTAQTSQAEAQERAEEQEELTLADSSMTTDADEIIRRKERKGLT